MQSDIFPIFVADYNLKVIDMKIIFQIFLGVCICLMAISCEDKAKKEARERKLALQQKIDSLSNTDVKLSFMGIEIGGDIKQVDEAIKQGTIENVADSNDVYIGNIVIPYSADAKVKAIIRIMTIDKKVATIELLFRNQFASRFFVETFQERYYDDDELQLYHYKIRDDYLWDFKEQYVRVIDKKHGEPQETTTNGKYNIERVTVYDATAVEYFHKKLYDKILEKAKQEKAIKDRADAARRDSIRNLERIKESEIKRNI